MTREERRAWLIGRKSSIGSSDAPNLVGVGFRTAADVYRSKTEPVTEADITGRGILKRGIVLEPIIAAEYTDAVGEQLVRAPWICNPSASWQSSSPDWMFATNPRRKVETKSAAGFGFEWGDAGTDDFPEGYRVQCQHQMGVESLPMMDLAALDVISWEFRIYRIIFNPDFWFWLSAVERTAWDMIEARQPIGPGWEEQFKVEALQRSSAMTSERIDIPKEFANILERREQVKMIRDKAEEMYKSLTDAVYDKMGDARRGECDGWRISQWEVPESTAEVTKRAHRSIRVSPPKPGRPAITSGGRSKKEKFFK